MRLTFPSALIFFLIVFSQATSVFPYRPEGFRKQATPMQNSLHLAWCLRSVKLLLQYMLHPIWQPNSRGIAVDCLRMLMPSSSLINYKNRSKHQQINNHAAPVSLTRRMRCCFRRSNGTKKTCHDATRDNMQRSGTELL